MKKLAAAILGLFVLITGCIGFGESESKFTISSLSDEELIELYKQINEEIVNRKIEKTAHLKPGVYFGVDDIPAGEYLLFVDNSEGDKPVIIGFSSRHDYMQTFLLSVQPGKTFQRYITIEDQDKLEVYTDFDLIIKPRGDILFE